VAIDACESEDVELRDTGARAIGKFVECIAPADLPANVKAVFMEKLRQNLADSNPGIRAKAVRSWGKLARYGHLDQQERAKLKDLCNLLLGKIPEKKWDRAYIVRKQAEEALRYT
jgi:hypothetical protein